MIAVLLIEDELWLAESYADELARANMDVRLAPHAHAAMAAIEQQLPDVIIADMLLTGTTVIPLLHELQSHSDTKQIPVILCTNVAEAMQPAALQQYGVRRILDKTTMLPDDIVAAVRSVML